MTNPLTLAGAVRQPLYSFHVPTKQGAPELAYLALVIHRACYADDEDEELVLIKWNEQDDGERASTLRKARFVLDALGGNGSVLSALRHSAGEAGRALWISEGKRAELWDHPTHGWKAAMWRNRAEYTERASKFLAALASRPAEAD